MSATARTPHDIEDVKGWLPKADQFVLDFLLGHQEQRGVTGDLLEMGAYLGKSTILIGFHRRKDERFVVCDLFGDEPPSAENKATAASLYTGNLTREAFEANYRAFHAEPPEVLQAPTSAINEHVDEGTCRFVHIDAAHLYDNVREDIETARRILTADGIVVFDDYRTAHTPGVAAAVWPELVSGDLRIICTTSQKLYATWGDPAPWRDALVKWLESRAAPHDQQTVAGQRLVRVADWRQPGSSPVPRARDAPPVESDRVSAGVKRLARDVFPPVLTRAIKRSRSRHR